jgi:signal transduction histidine kinase
MKILIAEDNPVSSRLLQKGLSMKILIAEDNPVSSRLLQKALEKRGHEILCAEDGLKAWDLLKGVNIQMVITDWMMPEMDGVELCRNIRASEESKYVYIILVTAKSEKEDILLGLEAGADDYIVKPLDIEELDARIRSGQRIIQLEEDYKKTYMQLLQSQLLQSEKMASIGQLAAGVAHEINNPATFVGVNAVTMEKWWKLFEPIFDKAIELGWDQEPGLKKLPEMLANVPRMIQSIKEGTARISSITSALREFARPSNEKKQLTDIRQVFKGMAIMTKNRYKYHAELVIEDKAEIPKIFGNSQKLEQVFVNLIINAADAIKEKADMMKDRGQPFQGLISISTSLRERPKKRIEIVIKDNGIGMETDVMKKVFDPFFTTKSQKKGTGLGMSIVYGIIEDHGGTISVESTKGEGTGFTVTFPIQ